MRQPARTPLPLGTLLVVAGMVLALLLAEVVLRVHNPFGFRMRGNRVVLPVNASYVITDPGITGLEGLDTRIVHRKNALGFRGEDYPADFPQRLSIITVGGSTTESFYISDGKTWPDLLARRLRSPFPALWLNNAGLDGHSTWGHTLLIRDYIRGLQPDLVVLLVGLNDLFAAGPNAYDRAAAGSLWGLLADYSEVVSTILNLYRARQTARMTALGTIPKPRDLREVPQRVMSQSDLQKLLSDAQPELAAYRKRLAGIIDTLLASRIAPVLLTQPSLLGPVVDPGTGVDLGLIAVDLWGRQLNGAATWRLLEAYNDVTRTLARERGVPLIDLARQMPKSRLYYYDFFHFNNEGSALVADLVYRQLCPELSVRFPEHVAAACAS